MKKISSFCLKKKKCNAKNLPLKCRIWYFCAFPVCLFVVCCCCKCHANAKVHPLTLMFSYFLHLESFCVCIYKHNKNFDAIQPIQWLNQYKMLMNSSFDLYMSLRVSFLWVFFGFDISFCLFYSLLAILFLFVTYNN